MFNIYFFSYLVFNLPSGCFSSVSFAQPLNIGETQDSEHVSLFFTPMSFLLSVGNQQLDLVEC